ncbi:phage holin family protein [Cytophagaceae bacterium YF14B1]|uniref:Phage holin family protein n=1 Tax=Xanthocytophaga flava TaxID=3048013 RepID=A0AAE3UB47_9BACT|nr:phage holin family protein [Xanthocytophaga flavus]MDJ1484023.1 phage holin family protein [Xanthocytophaga flavus]
MAIDKILENVLRYIESRFELFKLEIEESVSIALVRLIQGLIIGILGVFVLLFFSWGVANALNVWLNSTFVGYFIVGGIYLILMLAILSRSGEEKLKQQIEGKVSGMFDKQKKKIDTEGNTEAMLENNVYRNNSEI